MKFDRSSWFTTRASEVNPDIKPDSNDNSSSTQTFVSSNPYLRGEYPDLEEDYSDNVFERRRRSPIRRLARKISSVSRRASSSSFNTITIVKKPSLRELVRKLSTWSLKRNNSKDSIILDNLEQIPRKSSMKFKNLDYDSHKLKKVRFNVKKSRSWLNLNPFKNTKSPADRILTEDEQKNEPILPSFQRIPYGPATNHVEKSLLQAQEKPKAHTDDYKLFLKNTNLYPKNLKYVTNLEPSEEDWNDLYLFILDSYKKWEAMEHKYTEKIPTPTAYSPTMVCDENLDPTTIRTKPPKVLPNKKTAPLNTKSQESLRLRNTKWETR